MFEHEIGHLIRSLSDKIEALEDRSHRLEQRAATSHIYGQVTDRDHEKGVRINLGEADGEVAKSAWIQPGDRTGASRYLPQVGEQVAMFAPGGDPRQAYVLPYTHSDEKKNPAKNADETVHHDRDGQRHTVEKGHVKDQAAKKHSRAAGDGGKEAEGSGKSGANLPHELQRQLQGIRATLTQHDNNIAGLHQATSSFRDIVQKVIPGVAAVQPLLNGDADSLGKAAQMALGSLESYVAKTFQQMMGKLTNGFMSNVMGLVQGAMNGEVAGLLNQAQQLASGAGLSNAAGAAVTGAIGEAKAIVADNIGAGAGQISGQLNTIAGALKGTPAEGAFAQLQGQITGALGAAGGVMASLGGSLDAQQNLVKGMTKSDRLGGYEGDE